jgi:SAM-dependent methyltransferase
MDRSVYDIEAKVEETHWWFVGRRDLFGRELKRAGVAPSATAVLDIGCSTGTNLRMLRKAGFERVLGLDANPDAVRSCSAKGLGPICQADVCAMPFPDGSFDLAIASDVIEHIDDDAVALREIARVLRPGSLLLLTVPAFSSLWGLQDRVSHHRRRYRLAPLRSQLEAIGLRPLRMFYFNYLLFVPIWLGRRLIERCRIEIASEAQINTPLLNLLLGGIFEFDARTAPLLHPPFGVSIFMLAAK